MGGAGAPTITTYTYDANDRLLSEGIVGGPEGPTTTLYTYDANGNTTGKSAPGVLINYDYDDANRLKEMRENGERTTYEYNVDGIRVAQTKFPSTVGGAGSVGGPGGPTRITYLVDTNFDYAQVVEEYTQVGTEPETLSAAYAYGHAVLSQTRYVGGSGSVGGPGGPTGGSVGTPTTRFIHADGFGSTRYLTDATSTKTDRIDYDAFGNEIARTGTTAIEHLYRGEQYDPNLGWYNLRARYYDPNIGRFATMDSFRGFSQDPVSLHKYLYANADPVNLVDPSGYLAGPPGMVFALQLRLVLAVVANVAARAVPIALIAAALAVRSTTGSHPANVTTELRRRGNNVMRLQLQQGLSNHYWSRAMAQRDPAYVTAGEIQANLEVMFLACRAGDCAGQGRKSFAFTRLTGAFRSAIIRMSQWVNTAGPFTGGIFTVHQEYVVDSSIKDPSDWPRIDLEQVFGTNLRAPRQ